MYARGAASDTLVYETVGSYLMYVQGAASDPLVYELKSIESFWSLTVKEVSSACEKT